VSLAARKRAQYGGRTRLLGKKGAAPHTFRGRLPFPSYAFSMVFRLRYSNGRYRLAFAPSCVASSVSLFVPLEVCTIDTL
jgi:hypothetical protein